MDDCGRNDQLYAAPGQPTAPNLTMLFNNGYNPRAGQTDDQAVVYIQDIRNGQNVTGHALISGHWNADDNPTAIANKTARIDHISNGPFTLWLPHCPASGDWRVWIYYLNESQSRGHNVIGQYDIYWNYEPGQPLLYKFVNYSPSKRSDIPPAGAVDPSNRFNFNRWRQPLDYIKYPEGPTPVYVEVRGPLTSGERFN